MPGTSLHIGIGRGCFISEIPEIPGSSSSRVRLRFRPRDHIRRPEDFQRAFEAGKTVRLGVLTVRVMANGLDHDRLGLVVSRRFGPACRRNRLRRKIREGFRLARPGWPAPRVGGGFDLVVGPSGGKEPDLSDIRRALAEAVARAGRGRA